MAAQGADASSRWQGREVEPCPWCCLCSPGTWQVYEYARNTITNDHRLWASKNRNLFSSSARGQKSEIKLSAGACPSEASAKETVPRLSPSSSSSWHSLGSLTKDTGTAPSFLHFHTPFFLSGFLSSSDDANCGGLRTHLL